MRWIAVAVAVALLLMPLGVPAQSSIVAYARESGEEDSRGNNDYFMKLPPGEKANRLAMRFGLFKDYVPQDIVAAYDAGWADGKRKVAELAATVAREREEKAQRARLAQEEAMHTRASEPAAPIEQKRQHRVRRSKEEPIPPPVTVDDPVKTGDMMIECKRLVKENLHAPDDAEFPGLIFNAVPRAVLDSNGNMFWRAWVKAPNLFGVKLTKWFNCRYDVKTRRLSAKYER